MLIMIVFLFVFAVAAATISNLISTARQRNKTFDSVDNFKKAREFLKNLKV